VQNFMKAHLIEFDRVLKGFSCSQHLIHECSQGLHVKHGMTCRAMSPEERKDLSLFTGAARQRVAGQVSCNVQQVHILPRSKVRSSFTLQIYMHVLRHLTHVMRA